MDKGTRGMALLLATQFQAIILLGAGWYGGNALNESYPASFDWLVATIPGSLILVAHSFYVVFKFLIKKDKEDKKAEKNDE